MRQESPFCGNESGNERKNGAEESLMDIADAAIDMRIRGIILAIL